MGLLTQEQKDTFWRDGVLVVEDAVTSEQLAALRSEFASWVEESRAFTDDYGETLENGPLEVLPGPHKGPIHSHWRSGVFTGAVDGAIIDAQRDNIVKCTGKAGSVCLMHANLLHGSAPNLSDRPRTLYITTCYAEDAVELSPNHLPSTFTRELVRGEASGRVRCTPYEMELPAVPKATSFFAQQEGADMG